MGKRTGGDITIIGSELCAVSEKLSAILRQLFIIIDQFWIPLASALFALTAVLGYFITQLSNVPALAEKLIEKRGFAPPEATLKAKEIVRRRKLLPVIPFLLGLLLILRAILRTYLIVG